MSGSCNNDNQNIGRETALEQRQGPWDTGLLGFALFLALVSYLPTLKYGFVFDDVPQIVENPAIKSWSYLPQYFTAHVWAGVFPSYRGSFYRPVFLLWLRVNYLLFNLTPWGWHLTSLLVHLAVVWVFFFLVRQWTADGMVAGWAALLFSVHPIHIEAVAWVSAVPEIQFSLAGMAAICSFVRFRREQRNVFFYSALVLYAIGLLAKETAVIIWPLIVACDRWLDRGSRSDVNPTDRFTSIKVQVPFAAITAVYFGLRFYALRGLGGDVTHTLTEVVRLSPGLIWCYLQRLIAPFALSEMYFGAEDVSFSSAQFLAPLFAVSIVSMSLIYWGRKSKVAGFSALLLGLSLVPPLLGVMVFPRHELSHNRYAYFPSAGACILFALALQRVSQLRQADRGLKGRWLATIIAACVALVLAISVRAQEQPYHDNVALFSKAVQLSPESAAAWGLLGEEQMTLGLYTDGIASFRRAQALEPGALLNNYRLGAAYYLSQDMANAEAFFQRALDTYHDGNVVTYDYALYRLGLTQYAQGRMHEAESTLRRAIHIQPKGFGYHLALGAVFKYQGKLLEAKEQFEMELRLGPDGEATALLRQVEEQLGASGR